MATDSADDLEATQKENDNLVSDVNKLREQVVNEERKLVDAQQLDSVKANNDILAQEKARLEARLAAAKQASSEYKGASTPLEQAEAAAAVDSKAADEAAKAAAAIGDNNKQKGN